MSNNNRKTPQLDPILLEAYRLEGWEVEGEGVWAYGTKFPLVDPLAIHLKVYRSFDDRDTRYDAMVRSYHLMWKHKKLTFNYWMERVFREHCDRENKVIVLAGGGGIGKTQMASEIATIFWTAQPFERAVITASTTLDSLRSRIFGYVERSLKEMTNPFPFIKENSPPPKIHPPVKDYIHGIYAIAANRGDDDESIKNWIGRHPRDALLLILDESTDLPVAIAKAKANLEKGLPGGFQIISIGNSNDTDDLHGLLATPEDGWENVSPDMSKWKTTQPGGICLYFNPYESPAIHETDPDRKKALSGFLMTEEKLLKAEAEEGTESEAFWRFTMGFWKKATKGNNTIVTEEFLREYDPTRPAEFSGKVPLVVCGGLDPAFSIGGDKCILRLAVLGHHVNGQMVLDFRGPHMMFDIKIMANTGKTAEIQIADAVIDICAKWNVPLNTLCIDASGQGRGLAEIIQLRSGTDMTPTKIYSTNPGLRSMTKDDLGTYITSGYELWYTGRQYISNRQIYGLDSLTFAQLHNRQFLIKAGKKILEPKTDYKKRMNAISSLLGRSPDEADATMLTLQSAIIHHGFHVGQEIKVPKFEDKYSREYFMAMQTIQNQQESARSTYRPKPGYSSSMVSLVGKKRF